MGAPVGGLAALASGTASAPALTALGGLAVALVALAAEVERRLAAGDPGERSSPWMWFGVTALQSSVSSVFGIAAGWTAISSPVLAVGAGLVAASTGLVFALAHAGCRRVYLGANVVAVVHGTVLVLLALARWAPAVLRVFS